MSSASLDELLADFSMPLDAFSTLFSEPSSLYPDSEALYPTQAKPFYTAPADAEVDFPVAGPSFPTQSLASLFEQHTAHLVRASEPERPRHRRRQSSTSSNPYSRPPSTTPRNVSHTPEGLAAAGIEWESWMGKEAPKTRRILNALLNPHAFTRTTDACVQCAMDGVPCMLDIGVAPHEGIPCASCRGVRCTFKTQARRTSSSAEREPEHCATQRKEPAAPASTCHSAPSETDFSILSDLTIADFALSRSPTPAGGSPSEADSVVTPPTRSPSPSISALLSSLAPPPFLAPLPGVTVSTVGSSLYQPQHPCVGCHSASQPCIITTSETREGPVPPCGCCSAAGLQCLFVFAREGWAYLSPPVLRDSQATWMEGCAGFPV